MAEGNPIDARNYWGIVVTNMLEGVNERHFHPMLPHAGEENGQALVWPNARTMVTNYDAIQHGPIQEYIIERWQTPLPIYESMRGDQQRFVNAIKKAINSVKCSLCFHDGNADISCEFNERHLHVMIVLGGTSRPPDLSWFRTLRNVHPHLRYEKIRLPLLNFAKYMTNAPRIYLGTNDEVIYRLVKEPSEFATATAALVEATMAGANRKKTFQYVETEDLIGLMRKHNTQDRLLLTQRCRLDPADDQRLRELVRSPRWTTILRCAKEEIACESKILLTDYYSWFMNQDKSASGPMMSVQDTRDFFDKWCEEQNINSAVLLLQMYVVIRMVNSKRNTLYLQGRSNAGKTFMVQMMLPDPTVAGNHISSREFAFQECVNKPLILINELTISTTAEVELYKYVLGGELVMVNVKNRSAEFLRRTPVIVTSNNPMWTNVLNEKDALKNRCYAHLNLKRSKVAAEYATKGIPNFHYLQQCFRYITDTLKRRQIKAGEDTTTMPQLFPLLPLLNDRMLSMQTETDVVPPAHPEEAIPVDVLALLDEDFEEIFPKKADCATQVRPKSADYSTQTEPERRHSCDDCTQTDEVFPVPKAAHSVQTEPFRHDPLFEFKAKIADQPVAPLDLSLDARENPFSEITINRNRSPPPRAEDFFSPPQSYDLDLSGFGERPSDADTSSTLLSQSLFGGQQVC